MKLLSLLTVAAGACLLFSCGGGGNSQNSADSAKTGNDSSMGTMKDTSTPAASSAPAEPSYSAGPVDKDDSNFAVDAANGGMTEIAASQLAQNDAVSQRLKDFANMMVRDHTKAGDQLKKLASAKSITLPTAPSDKNQKKVDALGKKTGSDFDKAYVKMMLDDHQSTVEMFTKESDKAKDGDIKNWATQTLPTLEMHLDSIKAISGKH